MFPFPTTPAEAGKGILISFVSVRQGAGSSTMACMTALSMANLQEDVAIIDFNPESKVRAYLGYPGDESVSTVSILDINSVPVPNQIFSAAEQHHAGIKVFPGVSAKMTEASLVDAKLLIKAAAYLKQASPLSIAVLGPLWGASWTVPMVSDLICVVVRPDRPNMDSFRETTEFLSRLGCQGRIRIMLNQLNYPGSIEPEGAKQYFMPDYIIPFSKSIAANCNRREMAPDRKTKDILIKLAKGVEQNA